MAPAWYDATLTTRNYVYQLIDNDILRDELNLLVGEHPDLEKWDTESGIGAAVCYPMP